MRLIDLRPDVRQQRRRAACVALRQLQARQKEFGGDQTIRVCNLSGKAVALLPVLCSRC